MKVEIDFIPNACDEKIPITNSDNYTYTTTVDVPLTGFDIDTFW